MTRRLVQVFHGLAFAGWLGLAGPAPGQGPKEPPGTAADPAAGPVYTQQPTIMVQVNLDSAVRAQLRSLELWVKGGTQAKWIQVNKVPAAQKVIPFRAPEDGAYAFIIVSEDRAGNRKLALGSQARPYLVAIVDTQPPETEVQVFQSATEELYVQCEMRDANPAADQVQCECQMPNGAWRSLQPVNGYPGYFKMPPQGGGSLRVTAKDLAGNSSTQVITMEGRAAPAPAALSRVAPAGREYEPMIVDAEPPPVVSRTQKRSAEELVAPRGQRPPDLEEEPAVHHAVLRESQRLPRPPVAAPAMAEAPARPAAAPRKLLNAAATSLEYQIEQTGPSGIGRVEVWLTRDRGQSWQRLTEDADGRSPVAIELPGEGLFGLTMVVSNGRGFGGDPPANGTAPDYWIEVDATPPEAQLLSVKPSPADAAGTFVISWSAADKNLGPSPVTLFHAASKDGPWQPIGGELKNDGQCRWQVPADAGRQCYVRLVVRDQAGNVKVCETPEAVPLDDLSRPRARVVGVSAGGK